MNAEKTGTATQKQPVESNKNELNQYDSQTLFADKTEIIIHHAGHEYRLRVTRQDKLILTK